MGISLPVFGPVMWPAFIVVLLIIIMGRKMFGAIGTISLMTLVVACNFYLNERLIETTFGKEEVIKLEPVFFGTPLIVSIDGYRIEIPNPDIDSFDLFPTYGIDFAAMGQNAALLYGVFRAKASIGEGISAMVFDVECDIQFKGGKPVLDWNIIPVESWPGTAQEFESHLKMMWIKRFHAQYRNQMYESTPALAEKLKQLGIEPSKVVEADRLARITFELPEFHDTNREDLRTAREPAEQKRRYQKYLESRPLLKN